MWIPCVRYCVQTEDLLKRLRLTVLWRKVTFFDQTFVFGILLSLYISCTVFTSWKTVHLVSMVLIFITRVLSARASFSFKLNFNHRLACSNPTSCITSRISAWRFLHVSTVSAKKDWKVVFIIEVWNGPTKYWNYGLFEYARLQHD